MRVVYYPVHFDAAGCYRCIYPGTQLKARGGHHVGVGDYELAGDEKQSIIHFNLDTTVEADLVVLQQPGQLEYAQFQKTLQQRGIKVVVDLDDDYLNLPSYNPASKAKGDHLRVLSWCLRHADAVTVTTPALRDSAARVSSAPIYVLRNLLDWRWWGNVPPVYEQRDWDRFRIGYLGVADFHSGDLQILAPWFGEWVKDHPDVDFVAVGDPSVHDLLGIPDGQRLSAPSFSFRLQKIAWHCRTMDVGLVPLADNRFNMAKSHLKGMEYAGAGVPCLASPTESYRDWWLSGGSGGPGGSGFLCSGRDEWLGALDQLYGDPGLRVAMGERARRQASEHTYQSHWRLWEAAYHEILGVSAPRSADERLGIVA
jgi:glycosyltransferase involved in cell wall biosynthesis